MIATAALTPVHHLPVFATDWWPMWVVAATVPLLTDRAGIRHHCICCLGQALLIGTFEPTVSRCGAATCGTNEIINGHLRGHLRIDHAADAGHAVRIHVHALDGLQNRQMGVPRDPDTSPSSTWSRSATMPRSISAPPSRRTCSRTAS
jgi:hypothetical protein